MPESGLAVPVMVPWSPWICGLQGRALDRSGAPGRECVVRPGAQGKDRSCPGHYSTGHADTNAGLIVYSRGRLRFKNKWIRESCKADSHPVSRTFHFTEVGTISSMAVFRLKTDEVNPCHIAHICGIRHPTISNVVPRAGQAGVRWLLSDKCE